MFTRTAVFTVALLVIAPLAAVAQDQPASDSSSTLKVGDAAPDFSIPAQKNDAAAPKKLSELRGKMNVLVAFYPKADTPGCTKQMCSYRDDTAKFQSANTQVLAVSIDQQMDSDKFQEKNKLPFPVVGDPQHKIIGAYGVPMKDVDGNKFAQRSVFLVDKEGKVRYIDIDYKIAEDGAALYKQMQALEQGGDKGKTEEKKP